MLLIPIIISYQLLLGFIINDYYDNLYITIIKNYLFLLLYLINIY